MKIDGSERWGTPILIWGWQLDGLMMDFSSFKISSSNWWILFWAQFIFFYKWMEANTFNKQFIPPVFGWDEHKEMIPTTLGCRNVKLSPKWRQQTWSTHFFLAKHTKTNISSTVEIKKPKSIADQFIQVKADAASSTCLWLVFGLQHHLHKPARVEKATTLWQSTYSRAVTRFTLCFDFSRRQQVNMGS